MPIEELSTVLEPRPLPNFVETAQIRDITERALAYIKAGFPIHFRGVAGCGKTTLAMHVAARIGRPVVMIHGDEEFSTSDLIGGEHGYRLKKVVDNFIHSVLKTEEDMQKRWIDNRLTVACKHGLTLIYDEFTRSRPEANNVLLSILQEKVLGLPAAREGDAGYLKVDPQFTAIFTSNPEEYAGVFRTQDALRDRMVTLDLDFYDRETEVSIAAAKSGIPQTDAERIVDIVRGLRESALCESAPTVRGAIIIAKSVRTRNAAVSAEDPVFRQSCHDVLSSETSRLGKRTDKWREKNALIDELIDAAAGNGAAPRAAAAEKAAAAKKAAAGGPSGDGAGADAAPAPAT